MSGRLVCDRRALPVPSQGSCFQSEERLSLQINLSARGDRPADLDKLKPYIIEHILVLLVASAAGQGTGGWCAPAVQTRTELHVSTGPGKGPAIIPELL